MSYTTAELFGGTQAPSGINFDRYEDIPVEATGSDVPSGIEDVSLKVAIPHVTLTYFFSCSTVYSDPAHRDH